jgi:hypothetical protein
MPPVAKAKLQWFGPRVEGETRAKLAERMNSAGDVAVVFAKQYAPVLTGLLRDSIELTKQASATSLSIHIGVENPDAYYAFYQEVGWGGRPGKYFLRRGMEHAKEELGL